MKQLLLIRHAKSSWNDIGLTDIERPLNKRGKKAASILGRFLKKKGLLPQLVITSPAKRAYKTAKKIIKKLKYSKNKIEISKLVYSGSVPSMVKLINLIDKKIDHVFIVGHNPKILELGNYLTGSNIKTLPTAGYILIDFKKNAWKNVSANAGVISEIGKAK